MDIKSVNRIANVFIEWIKQTSPSNQILTNLDSLTTDGFIKNLLSILIYENESKNSTEFFNAIKIDIKVADLSELKSTIICELAEMQMEGEKNDFIKHLETSNNKEFSEHIAFVSLVKNTLVLKERNELKAKIKQIGESHNSSNNIINLNPTQADSIVNTEKSAKPIYFSILKYAAIFVAIALPCYFLLFKQNTEKDKLSYITEKNNDTSNTIDSSLNFENELNYQLPKANVINLTKNIFTYKSFGFSNAENDTAKIRVVLIANQIDSLKAQISKVKTIQKTATTHDYLNKLTHDLDSLQKLNLKLNMYDVPTEFFIYLTEMKSISSNDVKVFQLSKNKYYFIKLKDNYFELNIDKYKLIKVTDADIVSRLDAIISTND